MKNTLQTLKRNLRIFTMLVVLTSVLGVKGWGQTTIFTESMGTVGGTTTIAAHEIANGFDNDAYTMTSGGATNPGDIRTSSSSSGYAGASGLANVYLTSTSGSYGFAIEGIDASTYTLLTVQFGYRKESASALPILAFDYWDGVSAWVNVPFTFTEAATASTGWYLSPVISLPSGSQINNLKLRWVKSGSVACRIDDIVLKGTASTPFLSTSVSPLSGFTYVEGSGPSTSQTYNLSGGNLSPISGNVTVTGSTNYEVSHNNSTWVSSFTIPYTSSSLSSTPVYVRLKSGLSSGFYNSEVIANTGGGSSSANVICNGNVTANCPPVTFPFYENFTSSVGSTLTNNCWTAHSGAGTNPITVGASTITYPGYLSSGVGNEVALTASGEDVNRTFTLQTSGIVYASFLVNVTSATVTGDYFFHLGPSAISADLKGRVFVKKDPSGPNIGFGVVHSGSSPVIGSFPYSTGTTYLIVLRYIINAGSDNDLAAIYINPVLNDFVPTSNWIESKDTPTDPTDIGAVALRQGTASNNVAVKIDGIRISNTWSDIVGLPAEPTNHATSFVAGTTTLTTIPLTWTDASGGFLPQNYLVKAAVAPAVPTAPVDGVPEANGDLVQNVAYGVQTYTFTGLTPSTTYNFAIWPYSYTGAAIDYKTLPAAPTTSGTTLGPPTASVSQFVINGFNYAPGGGPSAEQSFVVSGLNLTGNITVTPSADYEISTGTGGSFVATNPVTLVPASGNVPSTIINVRLKSGLALGVYKDEIILVESTGITTKEVKCNGSVTDNYILYSAADGTSNYSSWITGSNQGCGFNSWNLWTGGNAGFFLGDPAAAGITGMTNPAFGLYANPESGNSASADRTFISPLGIGSTLSLDWGVNWDAAGSGNKGISLYSNGFAGIQIININMGADAVIRINGSPMFSNYGTQKMTLYFEYVSAGNLKVYGTGRDGSESFNQTIAVAGPPDAIRFYASNLAVGDQRQPYFNNLKIETNPAVIPALASVAVKGCVELSADLSVENMSIGTGQYLWIKPGKALTVNGVLTNSAGITGLVVKSDATGTGSLIQNTASVPATVERYMTGSTWHLMTPPVVGQSIPAFVTATSSVLALNTDKYGLAPYVNNIATPKWDHYTTTTVAGAGNFQIMKGYEILLNSSATPTFSGTLFVDGQFLDLSAPPAAPGNAWNLVGNPYSAALNGANVANSFLAGNESQLDPANVAYYIWNGASYSVINYTSGPSYIPVGQSFFIKSKPNGASVAFVPGMRSHNTAAYNKSASTAWSSVKLNVSIGDKLRNTDVFFIAGTTAGLDAGYDAGMFDGGSSANTVYTRLDGSDINFAIQSLPDNNYENNVIPVGVNAAAGTSITFSAETMNIPSDVKVYLHDVVTNTYTQLNERGSLYSVVLVSASSGIGRFYLLTSKQTMGTPESKDDLYSIITVPSESKIRVIGNFAKGTQVAVYSLDGKVLYSGRLNNIAENEIRFAPAVSGIYLVRIQSGTSVINRKISWMY